MPIYEYRCNACGAEKDHLQKMSDAPIATCPACDSNDYIKLISAAGFQLKGSGWYVTDFKDNKSKKPESKQKSTGDTTTKPTSSNTSTSKKTTSTSD